MALSADEFRAAFPSESQHVEFKQGLGGKPIQETAVAFSNSEGGVILIGVRDDGSIQGRKLDSGTADEIHQVIGQVHNPGRYSIHELVVDEKPVVALAIAKRREGFSQQSNGTVRVRKGTRDEVPFGIELQDLVNRRLARRFEAAPTSLAVEDADAGLLEEFRAVFGWTDQQIPERLSEKHYANQGKLTTAGVLYLTRDPADILGKSFVELLRYRDEDSVDYDLRREFRGPIPEQLIAVVDRILELIGTEMVVLGARRYELSPIPPVALREVIANALAHRSYELNRTSVRVELRPSSVVVSSPGGLPEPVTVENMREASSPRNMSVISALRRFGLAEDAGRGINVIEDSMTKQMLDPPVFSAQEHEVRVTLPLRSAVAPEERAWVMDLERRGHLEGQERVVLIHAARGETLTNARVRDLLRTDSSRARELLQRLRDQGFLVQTGERGGATYSVAESLAPPAGLRLGESELLRLIESLATDKPISNSDVREATGLERHEVRALLKELVSEGRLIQTGSKRGTRYDAP